MKTLASRSNRIDAARSYLRTSREDGSLQGLERGPITVILIAMALRAIFARKAMCGWSIAAAITKL